MEAVSTPTIAVPLQHNRAHIIVQYLVRRAAEREKGVLVRLDQGLDPLVGDKLDIGGPAPSQGRDKHRKPVAAAANDRPVDLHLFAGLGLETNDWSRRFLRLERGRQGLEHRIAAGIAPLAQLPQQHACRDPFRRCRRQPFDDIVLERVELCRPRRTQFVTRRRFVTQIASNRVARAPRLPRDLPYPFATSMQYPDLQCCLPANHSVPSDCERTSLDAGSDFNRRPGSELQRR